MIRDEGVRLDLTQRWVCGLDEGLIIRGLGAGLRGN